MTFSFRRPLRYCALTLSLSSILLSTGGCAVNASEATESAEQRPNTLQVNVVKNSNDDDILARALLPPVRSAEDELFLEAWKNAQRSRWDQVQKQMSRLEGYPLYDYLVLSELNAELRKDKASPVLADRYEAFIKAHKGEYLAERALSDYLLIAASELTKDRFNRLYEQLQWNKGESPIEAAHLYFNAGRANLQDRITFFRDTTYRGEFLDKLSASIAPSVKNWDWIELLLTMQKQRWTEARELVRHMNAGALPASAKDISAMLSNPGRWLKKNEKKLAKNPKLSLLFALRMAPISASHSAEIILPVNDRLPGDERNMVWAIIGYHGATDLLSGANGWYRQINGSIDEVKWLVQPENKLEWAIRAALWAGDWEGVERLTRSLPAGLKNEEAWQYWRARALSALKKDEKARGIYEKLAGSYSFYGKLSSDMLNLAYYLPAAQGPAVDDTAAQNRWSKDPSIIRAQTFYRLEMYFMGHREWNWAMRNLSSAEFSSLAEYGKSKALLHRMINTAQRVNAAEQTRDQLFPMPHREQFEPIAEAQGTPLAWVYGVIRQESRFMPSVTSGAGAQGLMQIMPRTARWLVKKLNLQGVSLSDLHDLDTNVLLGSAFLNMLKSDLADSYVLATAAYNAGPGRARKWRSMLSATTESAIFIENIPFNETRDYVKNVMANTHTYSLLDGHSKNNFTQMIDQIVPNSELRTDLP